MAVTQADFNRIWASTSPLTPYNFSNTNYLQGWNFIGSTPPSRQMWDFLQKNNDEKMQYLLNNFDNYLPLSGGTMTGSIQYVDNGKVFAIGHSGAGSVDLGWNGVNSEGAGLGLKSTDGFMLYARDANNTCFLTGKPDGSLTWDNKDVERVNASGSNYIRYESGIQICWGASANFNTTGEETITFPATFTSSSYRLAVGRSWAMNWNENYYVKDKTNTSFKIVVIGTASTNNHVYSYVAVGFWK